jgi:hypothetical protein
VLRQRVLSWFAGVLLMGIVLSPPYGCDAGPGISLPLEWNQAAALAPQNYQQAMTSALDGLIAAIQTPSLIFAPAPLLPLRGSPTPTW